MTQQPSPTPPPLEVPAALGDIVQAVRRHRHEHAARTGTWPDVLVLVGPRLWEHLLLTATRRVTPLAWLDLENPTQLVLLAYNTRVVRAGIPADEWRLVVATEWRGTIET